MLISLLAVSAIVPSALLVWYFHARDVYPEPPRVLWTTFGIGVMSVVPVLALGLPLQSAVSSVADPLMASLLSALFVAALLEELAKLAVLVGYNMRQRAFDEPMDGIIYGVVASLGFATLENVLFVFEGGISVALSRAFTAVPLHAFVGAIMGYYVGQAYFNPGARLRLILTGYGIAVLLHALYDFPLMAMAEVDDVRGAGLLALVTVIVLLVCWRWTVRLVRKLHAEQLRLSSAGPDAVPDVPAVAAARPLGHRMGHLLVAILGGTMASFGGMVTLGLTLAFLIGVVQREHAVDVLIGGVLIGLAPLGTGVFLFRRGVRGMNAVAPFPPAAEPAGG